MICKKCGGSDVRLSSHAKWLDPFRLPLGQRALRCRTCHTRFYAHPGPELAVEAAAANLTKRSHTARGKRPKRLRRWIVEAVIFAVLLLLFWSFLKFLTREQPASSEAGNTPPGLDLRAPSPADSETLFSRSAVS